MTAIFTSSASVLGVCRALVAVWATAMSKQPVPLLSRQWSCSSLARGGRQLLQAKKEPVDDVALNAIAEDEDLLEQIQAACCRARIGF